MKNKQPAAFYIAEPLGEGRFNAGIVRVHNEQIMESKGFRALRFSKQETGSPGVKISRLLQAFQFAFSCPRGSFVVFHFPIHAGIHLFLLRLFRLRNIRTIALIIDIDGCRDEDESLTRKEMKILSAFSFLIVHNQAMKTFICERLPEARMFPIGIFDYPVSVNPPLRILNNHINIAGNFSKGGYVNQLGTIQGLVFDIYGTGYNPTREYDNIHFHGVVDPGLLPQKLNGSFGLVWDGPSVDTCDGNNGRYLRYNNPHKFSLYLAAGLPVIVWEESALAGLVKEKNLGIAIRSISDIPAILSELDEATYEAMQKNVLIAGASVRNGKYLSGVLDNVLEQ